MPTVTELADVLLEAIFEQYPMLATPAGSRDQLREAIDGQTGQ